MYESLHTGHFQVKWPDGRTLSALRWIGFWGGIALPAVHVSFIMTQGVTTATAPVITALWMANAIALVLGRDHTPGTTATERDPR